MLCDCMISLRTCIILENFIILEIVILVSILSVPYCVPLGISQTQASSPFLPKKVWANAAAKKQNQTNAAARFGPASASSSAAAQKILSEVFATQSANPRALKKSSIRKRRQPVNTRITTKRPAADLSDKTKKKPKTNQYKTVSKAKSAPKTVSEAKSAPAKKVLKMTRKCIMSRIYKDAVKEALKAGKTMEKAKKRGRKACDKARARLAGGNNDGAPPDVW